MMLSQGDDDTHDPRLDLGAEPYWMQDIRLAQRRIDNLRAARSQEEDKEASPPDFGCNET